MIPGGPDGTHAFDLLIRRVFPADQARMFQAFSDAELMARWWWPDCTAEIDCRPGGTFRLAAPAPGGGEWVVTGGYVEVEPPHRLVYTFDWEYGNDSIPSGLVFVDLVPEGPEATAVTVMHSGFDEAAVRDDHERGWLECLDRLEKLASTLQQRASQEG